MKTRFLRWLVPALGVGAFVILAWFTPSLWLRLDRWVEQQRSHLWTQLETVVGQTVVYERIAPNVLYALDFQNVRILAKDGASVLTAASIRLSLDWGAVFQGRWDQALNKVQLINASLDLDTRRDQGLLDHWTSYLKGRSTQGTTAFGFEIEGFNLTMRWTDGARKFSLERGFVVISPQGSQWGMRFRGALAWEDRSGVPIEASLLVRGDLRADPLISEPQPPNRSLSRPDQLVRFGTRYLSDHCFGHRGFLNQGS